MDFVLAFLLSYHQSQIQKPKGLLTYSYIQQELTILPENTEYCQTVYWYPNALELLKEAGCDLEITENEIKKAKRG